MEQLDIPRTDRELRERLAALKAKADAMATDDGPVEILNPRDGHPQCAECDGSGWRTLGRDVTRCPCTAVEVYADGTPYEFHGARLNNYREEDGNKTALAKARAFLSGTRDLYLTGAVGAGKTRLAASILNDYVRTRKTGYFARVPWMLHELQPGRESAALEERLASASLLVLDDVGAERDQATDYTRRTLLMLYEQRHDRGLRTIFTSNKTVQQLAEMQDDARLASRIGGRADVVKLTTPDQRIARRRA